MCGIVGYVGGEARAQDVILDGLRRLEYRGYDSAGIAVLEAGSLRVVRSVGKLINLELLLRGAPARSAVGIGHTRWATHGRPSEQNAHPHRAGRVAIVHNGIVENYRELRDELSRAGVEFSSETDTEVIAHLIDRQRRTGRGLLEAVRAAVARLEGTYALAAMDEADPGALVAAKNGGSPVIIGVGRGENFVASDIPAILPYTRVMVPLHDGDVAQVNRDGVQVLDSQGRPVQRAPLQVLWDPIHAEKGGYEHFMQKEIHEQPRAITQTIGTRGIEETGEVDLDGIDLGKSWARGLRGVQIVACGTASYAGMLGRDLIERFARVPVQVDLAHEFRYREPLLTQNHLLIPVSQSGETADTLGAGRRRSRSPTVTVAPSRASRTTCSTRTRGPRSAWRRPNASPRR
jgi:glucosamine--fructose-6-phosphate aminotransferase (isomerizing)